MSTKPNADIPESYFEYRSQLTEPMFTAWATPNPFLLSLYSMLRFLDVRLDDFSWTEKPANLKDVALTIKVQKLNAIIKVGIDSVTFAAVNPDWTSAKSLVPVFENTMTKICEIGKSSVASHEIILAMHVRPDKKPFGELLSAMVNVQVLGKRSMYGISVYDPDFSFVIDKSQKYPDSVFIRIERKLSKDIPFSKVADALYRDEMEVLGLLGLQELMES